MNELLPLIKVEGKDSQAQPPGSGDGSGTIAPVEVSAQRDNREGQGARGTPL